MMKFFALNKGLLNKVLVLASIASLYFLSSCTVQQGQSLLSAKTSQSDSVQRVIDSVPFAYDVAVDTISYNSCVGDNLNADGNMPGFKIGANEGFVDTSATGAVKAGVKLRSDFLDYIAKNVDPIFPNPTVSASQIKFILQNSSINSGLSVQFAVRNTTNLHVVVDVINPSTSEAITTGRDGLYIGNDMSAEPIATYLTKSVLFGPSKTVLSEGPRVYNLGSASSPSPLEGALGYNLSTDGTAPVVTGANDGTGVGEQYADDVRSKFNSLQYVLAMTFGSSTKISSSDTTPSNGLNSPVRKSETDLKKAYGKGFELTFSSKNSSISSWRKNLLTRVTEKNLEDGTAVSGASWTCENFVIMKTNQFNNKKADEPACSQLTASDLTDATIAAKVKLIRRHYSEDAWGIGLFYAANTVYLPANRTTNPTLCLVNKLKDCYLPTTGIITSNPSEDVGVQYDSSRECYLSRATEMGVTYTGNLTGDDARRLGRCAQYASICTRTSTSF